MHNLHGRACGIFFHVQRIPFRKGYEMLVRESVDRGAARSADGRSALEVIAMVAAMAAVAMVLAFGMCSCDSKGSVETQTVTIEAAPAEESEPEADADEQANTESEESGELTSSTSVESADAEAEPAPEPEAEPEPEVPSAAIDLSDPAQYQQVNLFLSNFSEVYLLENPLIVETASDEALASFTLWHTYRNSPDLIEHGDYYHGQYDYNIRITQERANEIAMRYFNRTINFENVNSMDEPCYCADGYVYCMTTNGPGLPAGITLAKSAVDQGNGTIRIDFDIYSNAAGYDATDTSLYSMSPDELMSYMGVSGPARTGSALVYYGDYNDYTGGLYLASWRADNV